VLIQKGCA